MLAVKECHGSFLRWCIFTNQSDNTFPFKSSWIMNTPRKKTTSLRTLARWGIEPGPQATMLTAMSCLHLYWSVFLFEKLIERIEIHDFPIFFT